MVLFLIQPYAEFLPQVQKVQGKILGSLYLITLKEAGRLAASATGIPRCRLRSGLDVALATPADLTCPSVPLES